MIKLPISYIEIERIYNNTIGSGLKSIAITATNPQEGCSTMAYALSRRAQTDGKRTLLVEVNLLHPEFKDLTNQENSNWLPEPESADQATIKDVNTSIWILPAPSETNSILFRNLTNLKTLMQHWMTKYDIVILDTSPIKAINRHNIPTELICSIVDGVVMMVMAGVTKRPSLQDSVEWLKKHQVNIVGFVYNDYHNPRLADELVRETYRLNKIFPKTMQKIRHYIKKSLFLNLEL